MKRIWMIGLILLLTGCSVLIPTPKTYTIEFNSSGGSTIESVEVDEDEKVDVNELYKPNRMHYSFDGWYYDEALNSPYIKNQMIDSDLTLYAKWNPLAYEITFNFNYEEPTETIEFDYQTPIEFPTPERMGFEFLYWYETNDEIPYTETLMPGNDLTLYAKWELLPTYHLIHFELNGSLTEIADVVILNNEVLEEPIDPTKEGFIFVGWFSDLELSVTYDFNSPITTDLTLYAKWQELHQVGEVQYEIDGDSLIWDDIEDAIFYDVYLGDDVLEPITTNDPQINLKPYEGLLINPKTIEVYVVFNYQETYLIFDTILQYENQNIAYHTGFEADDGFVATTSYYNQTTKLQGNLENQFSILSGSVSTTSPITGNQSLQFRHSTTNPNTYGYAENEFELNQIASIQFTAKSNGHHLQVSYSIDGGINFANEIVFPLTTTPKIYTYQVNQSGSVKIRFTLVKITTTDFQSLTIDDITMYSLLGDKTLIEIPEQAPEDYPETDEVELLTLKSQFQDGRSQLAAPGFTIPMTNEGKLAYYASLNGLTGDAFKAELRSILTTSHQRKISYNEARFVLEQSDLFTDNEGRQFLDGIYSSTKIVKYWDGGATWAREHVWPNSRLAMQRVEGSDKNQASDVHNLRAINPSVNSSRSNRYYQEGLSSQNGLVGTDAYYPGDNYIGDVARIIFYMAVRYDFLSLRDDDIDIGAAYTTEGAVMGVLSVLLEWHEIDPVDEFELRRNDIIYSYQGNRNPFIDYPEYVGIYYGN